MLSDAYLVVLARDDDALNIEDHITALYAMKSEEFSSTLGAWLGGILGAWVAFVIAIMVPGVPTEVHVWYWVRTALLTVCTLVILGSVIVHVQEALDMLQAEFTSKIRYTGPLRWAYRSR